MKKHLFASTAAAAMMVGGVAAAQGVTVFGDARLGFGYNTSAGGAITPGTVEVPNPDFGQPGEPENITIGNPEIDEIRAVSRVRFGVRMTGETDTGITFGATVRADNAAGGLAGAAGNVFVSGAFGTLTYGDIAAAHQQHTGDLPEVGLTALGFFNEPNYLGNRVPGADNRPTVRYDFDLAGFGVSASTNNDLDEIGVGASFSPQLGGGSITIGGGYYDGVGNNQWSAAVGGSIMGFNARLLYINSSNPVGVLNATEELGLGLGTTVADIGLNAFWREGFGNGTDIFDGNNTYGVGFTFNLGDGASLRGGYARTPGDINAADFGIQMAF